MIGAFSDNTHALSDVDANKFVWEMTLRSDGTSHAGKKLYFPG